MKIIAAIGIALTLLGGFGASGSGPVEPVIAMHVPRAAHSATLLADGSVLLAGGCSIDGCELDARGANAERYDPDRRLFLPTGRLSAARVGHAAVRARDGRVLVIGGWRADGQTRVVEAYDPARGRFGAAGSLRAARGGFSATLLRDGRVLVVGGSSNRRVVASTEIFDPRTGRSTRAQRLRTPRTAHTATRLPDGRVLVVGGSDGRRVLATAELWEPRTRSWRAAGRLRTPRHKHAAVLVPQGVLILGGSDERDFHGRHASAELYDARLRRFVAVPPMNEARFKIHDAAVAVAGGALVGGGGRAVEAYDASKRRFTEIGTVDAALSFTTATRLRNGDVLLAGGYDDALDVTARAWHVRG